MFYDNLRLTLRDTRVSLDVSVDDGLTRRVNSDGARAEYQAIYHDGLVIDGWK